MNHLKIKDDNEVSMQQGKRNCTENAIASKHERGCKFCRKSFATFAEVKGSQNPASLVADEYELRTITKIIMKSLIVRQCV
jgi:hypothetical protein